MYIVAYDISDDKERRAVVKVLQHFGERVQYSVWLCYIEKPQLKKLHARLDELDVQSGFIDIWHASDASFRTGNEELAPQDVWCFIC